MKEVIIVSILEKEVLITIVGRNFRYYEDKGYVIPRHISSNGKLSITQGSKILVRVEDLPISGVKLTKICDECDKLVPNQSYQAIIKQRKGGDGKDRCNKCGQIYGANNRKNNINYENSLEYWAKENNKEYLLEEFSDKNKRKANKISYGSDSELYLWNCPNCESEYTMTSNSRTCGSNCPYCAGMRVNHTNCLWTTNKSVAKLLFYPEDGYKYTQYSNVKLDWKCPNCQNKIKNKVICDVSTQGLPLCPMCSDGISYPEKFMFNVLVQLNVEFEFQKLFNWSQNKKYDFYIPSLNCIIETHGLQHYKYAGRGRSLEEEQKNDRLKEQLAFKNKIEHYIVVDCRKSDIDWMKDNIIKSRLCNLFNLSEINWIEVNKFACGTGVKIVSDLWNEFKNTTKVANELKIGKTAILSYLKQGTKIGWCDYDPKKETLLSASKNGKNNGVPVVRLSLDYEYIDEFESMEDVKLKTGITNVSAVCRGLRNKAGGYRWMYKEDYENKKEVKYEDRFGS